VTDWDRVLVSIAIDAAKNCIHVFEAEYPADNRPRKALEAAEKWLREPTRENRQLVVEAENRVWRSRDWKHGPRKGCGGGMRMRGTRSTPSDELGNGCHQLRGIHQRPRTPGLRQEMALVGAPQKYFRGDQRAVCVDVPLV
jgi:hypothetical protein